MFEHGLYAHANALFEYQLGGRWDSFIGSACVLQGDFGRIGATILGDDRVLWKSATLKAGDLGAFQVNVAGGAKTDAAHHWERKHQRGLGRVG